MTPDTFDRELKLRLGPGYRLRRSVQSPRWRIEQKIRRTYDYPGSDDRAIMLRDGVHLVMDTGDLDWTECPSCHLRLSLPIFERQEFFCPYCESRGVKSRIVDGYFPLVDKTLLFLERWHPRQGLKVRSQLDDGNRRVSQAMTRDALNVAEDLALDQWARLAGVPQFGRTKAGTPHTFGA